MQEQAGSLVTKNEVFNEIANLRWGSSFLILDETHFESMLFLNALLKDAVPPKRAYVISFQNLDTPFEVRKLALEEYTSLNDVSIVINQLRDHIGSQGIIIHNYLPHILVREDEESTLRMLEFWSTKTAEKNLVEFYTLPQGAFPTLEKKIASLTDGEIAIKFTKKEERQFAFTIKKACKPEYHLMEFPFKIEKDKLLIKWGEEFTDKLPTELVLEVNRRVEYLKNNIDTLKIVVASKAPLESFKPYEFWLLTQIAGKRVIEVQLLFPDKFDEILTTIARFNIHNLVTFEKIEKFTLPSTPKSLSLRSKLGLLLPTSISSRFLHRSSRYVVMDAHLALKQSIQSFIKYFPSSENWTDQLNFLERYFQQMTARMTALEKLKENKEDPRVKFDPKYFSKCISLTLYTALMIKPKVIRKTKDMYEVVVKDCDFCKEQKSDKPICYQIGEAIIGMGGVCFKGAFTYEEIRCKALGDDVCTFIVRRVG